MYQAAGRKQLLILQWIPYIYAVMMLGWYMLAGKAGIPPAPISLELLPLLFIPIFYYLFIFNIIQRISSRREAYTFGLTLTIVPPLAATIWGGDPTLNPHMIPLGALVFTSAALGPGVIAWVLGAYAAEFVSLIMSDPSPEGWHYAAIVLPIYSIAGLLGWLYFHRFYTTENPELRKIHQTLQRENIESEMLIAAIADEGLINISSDQHVQLSNAMGLTFLGIDDVKKQPEIRALIKHHERLSNADKARILTCLDATFEWKKPQHIDHVALAAQDDSPCDFSLSFYPIIDINDDEINAVLLLVHDLSAIVAIHRSKDEFLATASHELRTPLTVISGYSEALLREGIDHLTPTQIHYLTRNKIVAGDLLELVNDLLDLARIESGRQEFTSSIIRIDEMVNEVVDELEPQFKEKFLEVTTDCEPAEVYADRAHLKRALNNLLSNAHKYTRDYGHINVTTSKNPPSGMVEVNVVDDGVGIAEEYQDVIFEKFGRLKTQMTASTPGTGLGLAIVREIVKNWGGTIDVESDGEHGSRFYFTVPRIATNENTRKES